MTLCSPPLGVVCEPPTEPHVRSLNPSGTSFVAMLSSQSGCEAVLLPIESSRASPGEVGERVWGKVSDESRYLPTAGPSAGWRYGCNLGVDADDLLDQKAGWLFATTACVPTKRAVCKDVAGSGLGLAFRSEAPVSVPIRARWRCSIASNGGLAGLGHIAGVSV
jgi:hypothetical protein